MTGHSFDRRVLMAGAAALLLPGCGDDAGTPAKPKGGGAKPVEPVSGDGAFVQDVWIPYHHANHRPGMGFRPPDESITRDRARELAVEARSRVQAGQDIGYVAWRYSALPWGYLGGYSALPVDERRPTIRYREAVKLPIGGLTDIHEWRHGWWFAERIGRQQAELLERRVRDAKHVRARARVIHTHHAGAEPRRFEYDRVSQKQALAAARTYILKVQGGTEFATLAGSTTHDRDGRQRGGLMVWQDPHTRKITDWMTWRARRAYHYHLYEAIFESAPVGEVNPEPIVSPMGVDVLMVLERKRVRAS